MFKKKFFIILSALIFLANCEYKPIYSNNEKTNFNIVIQDINGDKNLNKFIIENLKKNSQKKSNQTIYLKINTTYKKNILAKDTTGTTTDYQSSAETTFTIEQNQQSKRFIIKEVFNYQKISDKYEEKNYELNIKKNLATSISQKLIIRLSVDQ